MSTNKHQKRRALRPGPSPRPHSRAGAAMEGRSGPPRGPHPDPTPNARLRVEGVRRPDQPWLRLEDHQAVARSHGVSWGLCQARPPGTRGRGQQVWGRGTEVTQALPAALGVSACTCPAGQRAPACSTVQQHHHECPRNADAGACLDLRIRALFPETPATWPCAVTVGCGAGGGSCLPAKFPTAAIVRTGGHGPAPLPAGHPHPPPHCRPLARGRVQPATRPRAGHRHPGLAQVLSVLEASPDAVLPPSALPLPPGTFRGEVPPPLSPSPPVFGIPAWTPLPFTWGQNWAKMSGQACVVESTCPPKPPSHPTARSPQPPHHRPQEGPAGPGGRSPRPPRRASDNRGSLGSAAESRPQALSKP